MYHYITMLFTSLILGNYQNFHYWNPKQKEYHSCNNYKFNSQHYYDEIIIQGIKNKKLLNQIKKFFKFDLLLNSSGKITRYEISNLLYKMKISGFFTKLKLICIKTHEKQKIIIYVSPNIIFSKIEVLNNNKKVLPDKYIKQLFQHQIGYPQSLYQLNTALQKLTAWYYFQGYYYTIIQIIKNRVNPEHIILNISEGIIDKIDFIFMPPYQNILLKSANIYIVLIQRLLGINIKSALNIKYLDLRIQHLKKQEILKDCSYTIEYTDKRQHHLVVKIYLFLHPSKTLNLLLEQFYHTSSTQKLGKHLLKYCFTQYFYNYYNKCIVYNLLKYKNTYQYLKLKQTFYIPIYTDHKQRKIILNFTFNSLDSLCSIDSYTWNLFVLPRGIWQIHQYIVSPTYFNCSMNLKLSKQNLVSEIRCTKPWISINTDIIGTIYCYVLKSIFSTHTQKENTVSDLSKYNFPQYISYFLDFYRIEVSLTCKLAKEILIQKLCGSCKIFYNYQVPQIYFKNNYFLQNITKNYTAKIADLSKIIKQNHIYFKYQYQYNAEDKLEEIPKGWSSTVQHITCIQAYRNINTIFKKVYINYTHLIYLKCLYYYQILISHNLISKFEFLIILGNNIITSLVKYISNANSILALNNLFQLTEFLKKLWIVTGEYRYMFNTTYCGFIFMNYGQNTKNNVYFYISNLLLNTIPKLSTENKYSIGLGIQIKSSIRRIDSIRLEYSIDEYANNQFYIKILR